MKTITDDLCDVKKRLDASFTEMERVFEKTEGVKRLKVFEKDSGLCLNDIERWLIVHREIVEELEDILLDDDE